MLISLQQNVLLSMVQVEISAKEKNEIQSDDFIIISLFRIINNLITLPNLISAQFVDTSLFPYLFVYIPSSISPLTIYPAFPLHLLLFIFNLGWFSFFSHEFFHDFYYFSLTNPLSLWCSVPYQIKCLIHCWKYNMFFEYPYILLTIIKVLYVTFHRI